MRKEFTPETSQPTTGEHGDWAGTIGEEKRALGDLQKLHEYKAQLQLDMMRPDALSGVRGLIVEDIEELEGLVRQHANFDHAVSNDERESLKLKMQELEERISRALVNLKYAAERGPKD